MNRIKKFAALVSAALVSASCLGASAFADPVKSGGEAVSETYTGWREDSVGLRYYENGVPQTKSRTIDGVRYKFSSDGYSQGTYTGWTKSTKGKRYWKNGKLLKNKWIKTPSGKCYYADEKGYMTVGWSDVTRIGGLYSRFDEKGVWDGKVYWSKSNPEAAWEDMLNETVRITIRPAQNESYGGYGPNKQIRRYLENSPTYTLEIPRVVADELCVGDTIVVNASVETEITLTDGEAEIGFYLFVEKSYYPYAPVDGNDSGVFEDDELACAIAGRLNLFNDFLFFRDDRLMLDRMFRVLGLSWEELERNPRVSNYIFDNGVYGTPADKTYALFGGTNQKDELTGQYRYRDGIGKDELTEMMTETRERISARRREEAESGECGEEATWVDNAFGLWIEATVEEIPPVS